MSTDFERSIDEMELDEEELQTLVLEQLSEHDGIDWGHMRVRKRDGKVYLTGQVGTEEEKSIAERVATDVVGINDIVNYLKVDPWSSKRYEPMGLMADDEEDENGAWMADEMVTDLHSVDLAGTSDLQEALEEGVPWSPPESATPGML